MAQKRAKKSDANLRAFVEEYIANGRNAKQAYKKFHPKVTERTATVEGSKLLTKPDVQAYLKQREQALQEKLEITTERVLRELARIAFSDKRKLYREDGTLKSPHEWDDDTAAAVAGIKVHELFDYEDGKHTKVGEAKEVRLYDKNSALGNAMKHLGLFKENNDQLGDAIGRAIIVPAKATNAKAKNSRRR